MKFLIPLLLMISAKGLATPRSADEVCKRMNYPDCLLVKAIIKIESNFNPLSVGQDGAGSLGLMQIKCSTAWTLDDYYRRKRIECKRLFDPHTNITYGIRYLFYLKSLMTLEPSKRELLSIYNGGYWFDKKTGAYKPKYCNAHSRKKKRNCKPGELFNKDYVDRVLSVYVIYGGSI